jgi:hypothetical protein
MWHYILAVLCIFYVSHDHLFNPTWGRIQIQALINGLLFWFCLAGFAYVKCMSIFAFKYCCHTTLIAEYATQAAPASAIPLFTELAPN